MSPKRSVEGSSARTLSREEGALPEIGTDYGFVGRDGCLGATVVDRKGASHYASSFLTAFIKSLGFKRILVWSDNERPLLSLIERVMNNLTGVELVQDDVSRR